MSRISKSTAVFLIIFVSFSNGLGENENHSNNLLKRLTDKDFSFDEIDKEYANKFSKLRTDLGISKSQSIVDKNKQEIDDHKIYRRSQDDSHYDVIDDEVAETGDDHENEDNKNENEDHEDDHENEDHENENHENEDHENEDHENENHENQDHENENHENQDHENENHKNEPHGNHKSSRGNRSAKYTRAQKYGYGTLSVVIITLLAFVGLTVFSGIGKDHFELLMQFFVALGVGTLSGDAILHIIPEIVGLHDHEAGMEHQDHHDEEENGKDEKKYTWRLLMVIAGIYLFYLFENLLKLWNQLSKSGIKNDDKGNKSNNLNNCKFDDVTMTNQSCDVEEGNNRENDIDNTTEENDLKEVEYLFWGITPLGIMVWLGDALHRFGDGIALGASFSSSWISGVGTSIAIFCHELPHEFGDFAIYLQNGMSKWKAILMNFLAACFSFIGLYVGLGLSEKGETKELLLAIAAGMFLYICLVDIMQEIIGKKSSRPIIQFIVQNIGLLFGWGILLLIALYEDEIIEAFA